mmetsp:Transcript_11303/g.28901  ORF Transcript_11303/g.28901 Transcript_11303/m.28901 type:complete len:177 (-) Transcript_11303:99-629(-)
MSVPFGAAYTEAIRPLATDLMCWLPALMMIVLQVSRLQAGEESGWDLAAAIGATMASTTSQIQNLLLFPLYREAVRQELMIYMPRLTRGLSGLTVVIDDSMRVRRSDESPSAVASPDTRSGSIHNGNTIHALVQSASNYFFPASPKRNPIGPESEVAFGTSTCDTAAHANGPPDIT